MNDQVPDDPLAAGVDQQLFDAMAAAVCTAGDDPEEIIDVISSVTCGAQAAIVRFLWHFRSPTHTPEDVRRTVYACADALIDQLRPDEGHA